MSEICPTCQTAQFLYRPASSYQKATWGRMACGHCGQEFGGQAVDAIPQSPLIGLGLLPLLYTADDGIYEARLLLGQLVSIRVGDYRPPEAQA